jgi:hypothetical protein
VEVLSSSGRFYRVWRQNTLRRVLWELAGLPRGQRGRLVVWELGSDLNVRETAKTTSLLEGQCVDMVHGLYGAPFSNSTKINILKFQKNSKKNS